MKRSALVSALVGAAALLVFLATLSRNLGASHDSITYINAIERQSGAELFHPHHLLYHGAAKLWLTAARSAGGRLAQLDGALIVSALNSLFGALSLVVLAALLRQRMELRLGPAVAVTLLAAFSYGFWFYSCCVEVYIIPLFFLLLSLWIVSVPAVTPRRALAVGLTHGIAILFHQVHVLFTPVVLVGLVLSRPARGAGRLGSSWRQLLLYATSGALTVLVPYALVLLLLVRADSATAALRWMTSYAHIPGVSFWNPLAVATALKAALGFSRALVGGQFLFAVPAVRDRVQLSGKTLTDEAFLVRELGEVGAYLLAGAAALFALLFLVALASGLRGKLRGARAPRVVILAAVWLACYAAFFFFWDSSNVEFWIPQALCLWMLFAWVVFPLGEAEDGSTSRRIALVCAMAALLAGVNYFGSIRFLREPANDLYRQSVAPIARAAAKSDLIVYGEEWIWSEYYARFSSATALSVGALALEQPGERLARTLARRIAAARRSGASVWITGEAVEGAYLADGEQARALRELVWAKLEGEWTTRRLPLQPVHVLRPIQ